jgi:glycosyltransferase involved in cell wall biosynthesis
VLWWARRRGIPLLFRGDSHLLGRGQPAFPQRTLLRILYRQFAAITHVGASNRDYFLSLGVPAARLFFSPHSVEAARFNRDDAAARETARQLRAALGLTGKRLVLFAGKYSAAKQPLELLRAFHEVATDADALVFVGDGELKTELETLARGRPDRLVRFLPFANQSEMPSRYLLADIFALPSRGHYETWGLAINEAMHLGVPCLVSDLVGCQRDLVIPGETGWVFPADKPSALTATLAEALRSSPEKLHQLGNGAQTRISQYTYQQTTEGLLAAVAALP